MCANGTRFHHLHSIVYNSPQCRWRIKSLGEAFCSKIGLAGWLPRPIELSETVPISKADRSAEILLDLLPKEGVASPTKADGRRSGLVLRTFRCALSRTSTLVRDAAGELGVDAVSHFVFQDTSRDIRMGIVRTEDSDPSTLFSQKFSGLVSSPFLLKNITCKKVVSPQTSVS